MPTLDSPHRVELLLGAALRDGRGGFAAARAWIAAEAGEGTWDEVCRLLAAPGADHTLDDLASAYVAEGRVPDRWIPEGRALDRDVRGPCADVATAAAYGAGVSGEALLDAFAELPLYAAVAAYYRKGTIHALGPRPLLVLAASGG